MNVKTSIVPLLLRVYPAAWRAEYGSELADVLAARPLGASAITNVVVHGLWQRVRAVDEVTTLGVVGMLAIAAVAVQSIVAAPTASDRLAGLVAASSKTLPTVVVVPMMSELYVLFLVGCSCWIQVRRRRKLSEAGKGAIKISFIAGLPVVLLGAFMLLGFMDAATGRAFNPWAVLFAPIFRLPESWIWGMVGGKIGHVILRRRSRAATGVAVACAALLSLTGAGHAQAPAVQAPDPNVPLYFEVAAVKPNKSGAIGGSMRRQPGGRVEAVNMPLRQLIGFAYQTTPFTLIGGPGWIAQDRFDIIAKLEGDPPPVPPGSGPDHAMLAMRTLLADRFTLKVHEETRELDVYTLVMAKANGGPGRALKRSTQDCSPEAIRAMMRGGPPAAGAPLPCGARMMPGRIQMGGLPLTTLLGPLGGLVGRTVIDRTGLTGAWDLELTFAPDAGRGLPPGAPPVDLPPADPDAPSIFSALQEELGLKLDATKAPVKVLVIDSVEQPTPD